MRLALRIVVLACATAAMLARFAAAQTAPAADDRMDFGAEGITFPQPVVTHAHSPRTAVLLGEQYQRNDPLAWKRLQCIAELGQVALPEGLVYIVQAMKDPSPEVRAQAARSAAQIGQAQAIAPLQAMLGDADARVRREAVQAAASLARAHQQASTAIERGLADPDPQVVSAALREAWLPEHGGMTAAKLSSLPSSLKADAAAALGRLGDPHDAQALLPLLEGDVAQRSAAVSALGAMGDKSRAQPVMARLTDEHPTVRRAAVGALKALANTPTRSQRAMPMLTDPDLTVREQAAITLTPVSSPEIVSALVAQLPANYPPLHDALRNALVHPSDDGVRQAVTKIATSMLEDPDPRRREDASFILGHLRSDSGIERHIALVRWDPAAPAKADWPLIAQAAESLGLIADSRAVQPLMALVKIAPDVPPDMDRAQQGAMIDAMANAMVSLGRMRHAPALPEAIRILALNPELCPGPPRAASAFAVGVLAPAGATPKGVSLLGMYDSMYESSAARFEALKALGNLRARSTADRLEAIAQGESAPDWRWIAHWSLERCTGRSVPYSPPTRRSEPSVSISDLSQ